MMVGSGSDTVDSLGNIDSGTRIKEPSTTSGEASFLDRKGKSKMTREPTKVQQRGLDYINKNKELQQQSQNKVVKYEPSLVLEKGKQAYSKSYLEAFGKMVTQPFSSINERFTIIENNLTNMGKRIDDETLDYLINSRRVKSDLLKVIKKREEKNCTEFENTELTIIELKQQTAYLDRLFSKGLIIFREKIL